MAPDADHVVAFTFIGFVQYVMKLLVDVLYSLNEVVSPVGFRLDMA